MRLMKMLVLAEVKDVLNNRSKAIAELAWQGLAEGYDVQFCRM